MRNKKTLLISSLAVYALTAGVAFAASDDLGGLVERLTESIKTVASLLIIVSYVAGVGFALAGLLQFKAHKDNPAQVPLSKPIVYLAVGAALIFLPSILETAGETIFGGSQTSASSGETSL